MLKKQLLSAGEKIITLVTKATKVSKIVKPQINPRK